MVTFVAGSQDFGWLLVGVLGSGRGAVVVVSARAGQLEIVA